MSKVFVCLKGIVMQGNRCMVDRIIFKPSIAFKNNDFVVVDDDTVIVLVHTKLYMGVLTGTESAVVKVKEGAPCVRITTPLGSYITGEFEVVECSEQFRLTYLPTIYEGKRLFERRIIK